MGLSSEDLMKKLEDLSTLDAVVRQEMSEALTPLISELRVSLDYYMDQVQHSESVEKLYLSSEESYYPIVLEALGKNLGIPIAEIEMLNKVKTDPSVDLEVLKKSQMITPICLGLCLRDL